jgi:fructose-specific component phosphotransferase system IIB-like protein
MLATQPTLCNCEKRFFFIFEQMTDISKIILNKDKVFNSLDDIRIGASMFDNTSSDSANTIAIGKSISVQPATDSVVVGALTRASESNSVAVGYDTHTCSEGSIAIGRAAYEAKTTSDGALPSIVIGRSSNSQNDTVGGNIIIGGNTNAFDYHDNILIGNYINGSASNMIGIGSTTNSQLPKPSSLQIGSATFGLSTTDDEMTFKGVPKLLKVMDNSAPPVEVNRITDDYHLVTKKYVDDYVAANISPDGMSDYVKKPMMFVNGDETSGILIGSSSDGANDSVTIGQSAETQASGAVAIGGSSKSYLLGVGIGSTSVANGNSSTALGYAATAYGNKSIIIGNGATDASDATTENSIVIGTSASATNNLGNTIILGSSSSAANSSIVIGNDITSATDANACVIGNSKMASITLGALTITIDSDNNTITFATGEAATGIVSYTATTA